MGEDLKETAGKRGLADARKAFSSITFRFAAVLLPAIVGLTSNALGNTGTVTAIATGVTAITVLFAVLLFSIWRAPYRQRDELRECFQLIRQVGSELKPRRKVHLSSLLKDGRKLFNDRPSDFRKWWGKAKTWIRQTEAFLKSYYGPHEAELFMSPRTPAADRLDGSISQEHNQKRLLLRSHMEEVRRILEKYPD